MNMGPKTLVCFVILVASEGLAADLANPLPADPFVWLEDVHGARAMDWVHAENAKTLDVLEKDPRYPALLASARAFAETPDRIPTPSFLGGQVQNLWQDPAHEHGIWRRTSLADFGNPAPHWQTLIDVDALARAEHANWFFKGANCEQPAERRCLVYLSDGGEDAGSWREFDVSTGRFITDGFNLPRGKQPTIWESRDALLVAREWHTGEVTVTGYPYILKRLQRGEPFSAAVEIFRGEPTDVSVAAVLFYDGMGDHVTLIDHQLSSYEHEYFALEPPHGVAKLALPPKSNPDGLLDGQLLVSLYEDWHPEAGTSFPSGALVAIDLAATIADPAHLHPTLIYAPGPRESLQGVGVTRTRLLITTLENVKSRAYVYRRNTDGRWSRKPLALPDNSAMEIDDADVQSDHAFITATGFLIPSTLWLADLVRGTARSVKALPAQFDASREVVEQFEAVSSDGTKIPYFLVRPRAMRHDGNNPTILYAYGGFQSAQIPTYDANLGKLWLERGGVYVLANIRGGGEFGPAWHEAGLKTHRQVVYDDFVAVARDLIARGVTKPARLGIMGGSNGGLLMGVEFTQHPELWSAVDMQVPLLDMLGSEHIAAGSAWVGEYGSIANPEERAFLASISPYHNLKPSVHYPEPLIWTTTKDDRVGPQHARKFAARLASMGLPYLFYEVTEGGHGSGATLDEQARTTALEFTYFARKLSLP